MKVKPTLLLLVAGFFAIFACTNPFIETVLHIETEAKTPTPVITPVVTYTVVFESNGGSTVPKQTVAEGGRATRPGNPAKGGYGFDDWYADSGLTTLFNFDTKITSNTTVYAWWKVEGMVWIQPGTFTMGSPEDELDRVDIEGPQHQVTLTKGFYMGKYQVTQAQYQAIMGTNPSYNQTSNFPERGSTVNHPVEMVSWYDVLVFCNRLSMNEGLEPAYRINGSTDPADWGTVPTSDNSTWNAVQIVAGSTGYRLPTEAQWEYACRAGTTTAYNTGTAISDDTGWYRDNSGGRTHEVGLKPANAWGLYDMHGNVFEWCHDCYGQKYESWAQTDPTGVVSYYRVMRGGDFSNHRGWSRSACRASGIPSVFDEYTGFRVIRMNN